MSDTVREGDDKLCEDEVVGHLAAWFRLQGFAITKETRGHHHGIDMDVVRNGERIVVEAKGARGNKSTRKHDYFDQNQIKVHLGMALVKALELKLKHPEAIVAIAHPEDDLVKRTIGRLVEQLAGMGIRHYWVSGTGSVTVV
ncbi:MAG: hypothetical protein IPG10_19735 [Flavobacteriales bacterium]|nr:hypothetical protein [Flavobacteriales bacterium]